MQPELNPARISKLQIASGAIALVVALFAAAVLLGWWFDIPVLRSLHPGWATMKANTALCFLLSGAALWLAHGRPGSVPMRAPALISAAAATVLATLNIVETVSGLDFGIDQMLASDPDSIARHLPPGQMSGATAFSFVLLGAALLLNLAGRDRAARAALWLVSLGSTVSALALIGYAYGVQSLYHIAPFKSVSLPTAIGFFALFAATALGWPRRGWVAVLAGEGTGAHLARLLLPAIVGIPILLGFIRLWGEDAGLFDANFGVAAHVVLTIVFIGAVTVRSVYSLERLDARREAAVGALRESEARFHTMADTMPALLYVTDADGGNVFVNERWLDYTGRDADAEMGGGWLDFVHPEDRERLFPSGRPAYRTREDYGEVIRLRGAEGDYRSFLDRGRVRRSADGEFVGYIGALVDIDEQRKLEAQLHQSQKLEAVGQLTGGIAHDFNNLLSIIIGNLEIIEDFTRDNGGASRAVETAIAAADRGAELTSRLLAFGRRQALAPQSVDFGKLVGGMIPLLRRTLGENIEIETVIEKDLWLAYVDPSQFENALLNLAINARDAMPAGGKLTIESHNGVLDEDYVAQNLDVIAGDYVVLAVSDTGCGMSQEVIEKAIQPFFTTKAVGKGTGLGLSMVYGLAKQSGGHLKIYSEVGHGTTVRLYLPRSDRAASDLPGARRAETEMPRGSETVLVVEDSADVRRVVVRHLSELGYRVLEADSGPAALDILDSGTADVDVLFTDVVLFGEMNGRELAEIALRRCPGLKILFTTGYSENAIVHQGKLDRGVNFLPKPYKRQELAERMRDVLAAGRSRD